MLDRFLCGRLATRRYQAVVPSAAACADWYPTFDLRLLVRRQDSDTEEHLRLLGGLADEPTGDTIGASRPGLRAAIAGERERGASYAGMHRTARDEGLDEIAGWLERLVTAGLVASQLLPSCHLIPVCYLRACTGSQT
jgi:hypothetical protein